MSLIQQIGLGFSHIFSAHTKDPSIFWVLAPIIILWFILEVYFGRHKKEKLGWNSTLANAITLTWICFTIMKQLFTVNFVLDKFIITILFLLYGILLIWVSFTHIFPERLAFILASPSVIYYMSYVLVLWGYDLLELTLVVFFDVVLLFVGLIILLNLIRWFIPEAIISRDMFETKNLLHNSMLDSPDFNMPNPPIERIPEDHFRNFGNKTHQNTFNNNPEINSLNNTNNNFNNHVADNLNNNLNRNSYNNPIHKSRRHRNRKY